MQTLEILRKVPKLDIDRASQLLQQHANVEEDTERPDNDDEVEALQTENAIKAKLQ